VGGDLPDLRVGGGGGVTCLGGGVVLRCGGRRAVWPAGFRCFGVGGMGIPYAGSGAGQGAGAVRLAGDAR